METQTFGFDVNDPMAVVNEQKILTRHHHVNALSALVAPSSFILLQHSAPSIQYLSLCPLHFFNEIQN